MSSIMKRQIPLTITAIIMIIMIAEYHFSPPAIRSTATEITNWGIVLSGFAILLGAGNMITYQSRFIIRKTPGKWWYAIICLFSMVLFAIVGLLYTPNSSEYQWLYSNLYAPPNMVIWALPVFWLISASFRTFRARNLESLILLLSGVITLIGFAPIGEAISSDLPKLADWIILIPTTGVNRGIIAGAGIGTFSMALRILLGRERGHIGETSAGGE